MKLLKIILAALLFSGCSVAFAVGPLDGIYGCTASGVGMVYISINSNSSTTVVTIPSLQGGLAYGYALGSAATATAWTGTSNYGYPYRFTATGATGAKTLNFTGTFATSTGGFPVSGNCSQII